MSKGKKARSRISKLREAAKLTQRELSFLVGVTENTIQNWERGRSLVDQIQRIIRLCEVLDCDVKDLIEEVSDVEGEQPVPSLPELRKLLGSDKSAPKTQVQNTDE